MFELMVQQTSPGLFSDRIWNLVLAIISINKLLRCNFVGLFGLFFDDQGLIWERCLNTGIVGAKAIYTV